MNPRLYIFKKFEQENFGSGNRIYFVVVNLDKAKKYPANFVCVLPTPKSSIVKPSTEFSRVFGKDSPRLAKKLLKNALRDEDDAEIRAEIGKRLQLLGSDRVMGKGMLRPEKHFMLRVLEDSYKENPLRMKR
jgi:hypothetical protein